MRIDLTHNKIIKETISESFVRSFNENLVPKLTEVFGESITALQMYEDHLADDFVKDGYFYYPLTVVTGSSVMTCWIKWDISEKSKFEGANPYAFLGEELDLLIANDVPIAFTNALTDRSIYFEEGNIKLGVSLAAKDVMLLSGKYSQTFIDEMARQLTKKIESAMGVGGIADSTVELDLFFAPDTYMEHTSENVTYRRLLLSAKGCSPRDFWVKWIRLNSSSAYSLKDNVSSSDIRFEIGEDVSHKIREKEYRFLVYSNSEKYRMAMGRKNITEWRELVKRAQKRGELVKLGTEAEESTHAGEVSDKLAEILERCGVSVPEVNVSTAISDTTAEADKALRNAVLGSTAAVKKQDDVPEDYPQVEFDLGGALADEAPAAFDTADAPISDAEADTDTEADTELDEGDEYSTEVADAAVITDNTETVTDSAATAEGKEEVGEQKCEDDSFALMLEIEKLEVKLRTESERYEALVRERELAEKRLDSAISAAAAASADADALRERVAELEDKLSAESEARAKAEGAAASLREEIMKNNNDIRELLSEIDTLKSRLEATAEESRRNEEKLRHQLELEEKERLRDKLLFAEAARAAKEESDRLARERELAEARAKEERERLEAARLREEEERRAEQARIAERERIENEMKEEALRRENAITRAKNMRARMEEEARAFAEAKYGTATPVSDITCEENTVEDESECTETAVDFTVDKTYVPEVSDVPETVDEGVAAEATEPADSTETVSDTEENTEAQINVPKDVAVQPPRYTYTSKLVRLLFRSAVSEYVTETVKNLITEAIKKFGKEKVYIKMKASVPDSTTVVLDVIEIPEQEIQLLIDIIHHLGNSNIGIYKVIME
ncbi:MAG: hypothetical protein IKD45_03900 [Clostridia bacterium]|nr:hypothetical protein [Clostridia bacterium]